MLNDINFELDHYTNFKFYGDGKYDNRRIYVHWVVPAEGVFKNCRKVGLIAQNFCTVYFPL